MLLLLAGDILFEWYGYTVRLCVIIYLYMEEFGI